MQNFCKTKSCYRSNQCGTECVFLLGINCLCISTYVINMYVCTHIYWHTSIYERIDIYICICNTYISNFCHIHKCFIYRIWHICTYINGYIKISSYMYWKFKYVLHIRTYVCTFVDTELELACYLLKKATKGDAKREKINKV